MNPFTYELPVKVYFGVDTVNQHLANELKKVGPNIMLAYGRASIKKNGIYDQVKKVLDACQKNVFDFSDIPANPTYEKVQEGIQLYKEKNIDLILAVGGGSVIDCCKIITAGTEIEEDLWNYQMVEHKIPEKMGNFATILTLSGAGAEMDCLGACTNTALNEKQTFVGSYSKFAILDPSYLMSVPVANFMPGVFDSLTHCLETYFGNVDNVSDYMNEGLMKDIVMNMKELINGNDTLEIRSNLMWDSSLIQTFLFNVGKPGDFQAHQIENMLGAYSHGTHGKQLAIILPRYYRTVFEKNPSKFARLARNVFEIREEGSDTDIASKGIAEIEKLVKDAHLPTTFTEAGYDLSDEVAYEVSQKCGVATMNQVPLTREEIYQLLKACK